jgi:hypothetical protein
LAITSQVSNSTATNSPPTGSPAVGYNAVDTTSTNSKPSGLSYPTNFTLDSMQTLTQPTGTVNIGANGEDGSSTTTNPGNAPGSKSGTWFTGSFTIEYGDDGDGTADDTIYWVLTDNATSGVYNILNLSYDNTNFNDGDTGDQYVTASNDEGVPDGEIVILGTYRFTVNFAADPGSANPDAWITSAEWYTGSFNIDVNGDGTKGASEYLNYTLSDRNSDGIYDTIDLSTDDDTFGEGDTNDGGTGADDDERETVSGSDNTYDTFMFTTYFWENPNSSNPDCAIRSKEWYEGSFTVDLDSDGLADDTLYFILSDMDSDGIYDTMDISYDTTYSEGTIDNGNVTASDDERITGYRNLNITEYLEFVVEFDSGPEVDNNDARIKSNEWYEGTFTIDGNSDGTVESDNVYYVLSDTNSDGVYETMDISMGDQAYGEGAQGDFIVDFSATDNTNDEQIGGTTDITLGNDFLFTVAFDGNPNADSDDAWITIKEWYEGEFVIDGDGDGIADDTLLFVLTDLDSDGIFDVMDISFSDSVYQEGDVYDNYVDFDPSDNSNDENITASTTLTLGEYNFTMEFDSDPANGTDDVRLASSLWFGETISIDSDADGVQDDVFYFLLSDTSSNGTYDTLEISTDTTFGEGTLSDGNVVAGNDELITTSEIVILGGTLEFIVAYDLNPLDDFNDFRITSNEWYQGTFTIDGDGDGTVESDNVYYVLTDTDSDGLYEAMDISIGDQTYGEGNLGDFSVDFSTTDNTDDENITAPSDITLGDYFLFTVDFDSTPNNDSDDVRIKIKEWYEGTFTIDADADGAADDTIYFVLTDINSDGIYDVMDISIGDQDYGEGDVDDIIVEFHATDNTNDENITATTNITLGTYNFTVDFDSAPNLDADDARINSTLWYEGFVTIDADDDGVDDDIIYYALSDTDSDGRYDNMDISFDFTYGEGSLAEGNVTTTDDERINSTQSLTLGDSFLFEVGFDITPPADNDDARITSNEWYTGTFTIDGDGDGLPEADNVHYVLSDTDSDGVYDTMEISMGDMDFGEGDLGDFIVDFSETDNTNDENITWPTDITLGDYLLFTVEFDGAPNMDSDDVRIYIKEWYVGTFTIDAETDGADDDTVNFVLTDTDSDGVFDVMDISLEDSEYGEGTLSDQIVDWGAGDNTNDEQINGTTDMVLGTYNFTVDFVNNPSINAIDATITSNEWFNGSFTIDSDGDGLVDDVFNFVLSDTDSDGLYETLELSMDSTYGEGLIGNVFVFNNDDELITGIRQLYLGNRLQFLVWFDEDPQGDGEDVRIQSREWYHGTFTIDGDGDGTLENDNVHYVLSDTNSNGLYDTMDISLGDDVYGEGDLGDSVVDFDLSDNSNDERMNITSDITLGDHFLFSIEFDSVLFADNNDARITIKEWYEGNFIIDSDGDGQVDDDVYFVLTDKDSNGLYDFMDISIGDMEYGEGALGDGAVDFDLTNNTNDERIQIGTNIILGDHFLFTVEFDIAPNSDLEDARITSVLWYEASLLIDADSDGAADDTVYYVLSDTDSDGNYDTMDISISDEIYGEEISGTIFDEMVNMIDDLDNDNDERIFGTSYITLGHTLEFELSFNATPPSTSEDVTILINEWYAGVFEIDADDIDDDGVDDDEVNYVLTDLDSDGLYDVMDISLNDMEFRETGLGGLSDGVVDYDDDTNNLDDENITSQSNITLGDSFLFTVDFDNNPGSPDLKDASIISIIWYFGSFSIDVDGDGIVDPGAMRFALHDTFARGLYTEHMGTAYMEISTDDGSFGAGLQSDNRTGVGNDEQILFPEPIVLGFNKYYVEHFDNLHDGLDVNDGINFDANDVKITSVQWNYGTAFIEGLTKSAVVIDLDSDGVFEEVYIDLNDDGDYEDVGVDAIALHPTDTISSPNLELDYTLLSIHPNGRSFEIAPIGASMGLTKDWWFGKIEAPMGSGDRYIVLLSDIDGDDVFETADFETEIPTDGLVDITQLTETTGLVNLGGTLYQVINIEDTGMYVRITSVIEVVLSSQNDISLTNSIHFGRISEADLTLNLNSDGDVTDSYHTIVLDNNVPGYYETVFIDVDDDDHLSDEVSLVVNDPFTIVTTPPHVPLEFDIDYVDPDGDYYNFKQTNIPVSTVKTDPNGFYELNAPIDGHYWVTVTNTDALWGYESYFDTNSNSGYLVESGDSLEDNDYYLVQRGNILFGFVNGSVTGNPIPNANVEVYDSTGDLIASTQTKPDGTYEIAVMPGEEYDMVYTKDGYHTDDGRTTGSWWDILLLSDTYYVNVWLVPDTLPPTLDITAPYDGETVQGTYLITATASDDHMIKGVAVSFDMGVTYNEMVDAGGNIYSYSWDTTLHSNGETRMIVRAIDFADNMVTDYIDCYIANDAEAPEVDILYPLNLQYTEGSLIIQIEASDNSELEFVNITLDGMTYQTTFNSQNGYYEYLIDTTELTDGLHTLSAMATDYAGNSQVDSLASGFYIDNNAPSLVVYSPLNNELVTGNSVFLDVDSEDPGSFVPTVQYRIDSGAWTTLPGSEILGWAVSWDSTSVTDGTHTISFRSLDPSGHMISDSIEITVDNNDPTVAVVAPQPGQYVMGSYTFKVIAHDDVGLTSVFITIDTMDYLCNFNSISGLWETTLDTNLFTDGIYQITATSQDNVPAHTQSSSPYAFLMDNNAPSLSIYRPSQGDLVSGSSVPLEVNSTDPGTFTPTVSFRIDSGAWTDLIGTETLGWTVAWDSYAVSNGIHTIWVRSSDGAGNAVYESVTVTVDNDDPVVSIISPSELKYIWGTYTFSVFASDDISLENVYVTIASTDVQASFDVESGLWEAIFDTTNLADGSYTVSATAQDGIPTHTSTTSLRNFYIDNNEPTLVIVSPQQGETVYGTNYGLDVDSVDSGAFVPTVSYRIDSGAWKTMSGSEALGWSDFWDSSAHSNGEHTITFISYDPAGHIVSQSVIITVDNDNPTVSVISPLPDEFILDTYTFSIFAHDDVSVESVYITIDSVNYLTSFNSVSGLWEYTADTSTFSDGSYSITATVKDGIPIHTQSTLSTFFHIDNNAPSITINSPMVGDILSGTSISIDASSMDPGTFEPTVQFRVGSGGWNGLSGSEGVGWTASWDSTSVSSQAYSIQFRAYDGIGNIVTEEVSVIVDNDDPSISLAAPKIGEYVTGTYTFQALASDENSITQVYITINGVDHPMGYNSVNDFWEVSLDTKTLEDGTYGITATVSDLVPSHTQTTSSIQFNVDNNPPEIFIYFPINGEHIRGTVNLNVVGSDVFMGAVQYSMDGTGWVSNTTALNTIFWSDGEHTLSFRASDLAGHTVYETQTVIVDNKDTDSDGIGDLEDPDIDGDGVDNEYDAFPYLDSEWQDYDSDGTGDNSDLDDDNDGVMDTMDDFPYNDREWLDSDSDGTGDNADYDDDDDTVSDAQDAFPYDPLEWLDTDSDGVGNNADPDDDNDGSPDLEDEYPLNPNEHSDSDLDGIGDNADPDDDNDGHLDSEDAFPKDASEWQDTDSDGIGNNVDLDDDGDGVADLTDDFPLNPNEHTDRDLDGIGDFADTDDDNDGWVDELDAFPENSQEWLDFDSDGIGNNADTDDDGDGVLDTQDEFPWDPNEHSDLDGDGIADGRDDDIDGDGFVNSNDAFPYDVSEWADFDGDGKGDQNDTDIDGDGVPNAQDAFIFVASESIDTDNDGLGDNTDPDDDGDDIFDVNDAFPLNPAETVDTDGDGVGDNSDSDIDGDGFPNSEDDFPQIASEWKDSDGDGTGDNADPDDDNDGVVDHEDYYPLDKNQQLEPFWWWWILISVLVLLLTFVIFITNKPPRARLGSEEEYGYGAPREKVVPIKKVTPVKRTRSYEGSFPKEKAEHTHEEAGATKEEEIECPACGMTFMVEIGELPTEIKCPYCGVTGALD